MLQYGILIGYTIIISYLFLPHFNAYGSVNRFFIYVTDTEQKQIQPCCNSTFEIEIGIPLFTIETKNYLFKNIVPVFHFSAVSCLEYSRYENWLQINFPNKLQ